MKNNKGMTMIEVVVVMALIAIVTSGTVLSVSSLKKARVRKQFDVLQSQTINLREKTLTSSDLTAGAVYYDSAEDEYYFIVFEMERSRLANFASLTTSEITASIKEKVKLDSSLEYYYSFDTETSTGTKVKITETSPLIIHYNRSNGKLVNNADYSETGTLNVYIKNSTLEKKFSISCSTGRIVDYN